VSTPAVGTSTGGQPRPAVAGRAGNDDCQSAPLAPVHEAAVLYAADHPAAAEAILRAEIQAASRPGRQAWLMLFDLLEITGNRAGHEALAKLYAARFDQPAPAWTAAAEAPSDPRRAQNRDRRDYFVLKPSALGELAPEIARFAAFAETMGSARLDLGKVASLTAAEADALAAALQRLRRAHLPLWLNGAASLEALLRQALNERPLEATRGCWVLLFELAILQGRQGLHEELALAYAVAFGKPAPAWESYVNPLSAGASPGPAPREAPAEGGVALRGVLSAASQAQFADLAARATAGPELVVDMGKVLRVDFSAGALFFEAVKAIQLAGKRVILANLSELNAALLEAFGFNRHAILLRRDPRPFP